METPSSVFSSVFGRRKSKVSRSKLPPSISLPPAEPDFSSIAEHHDPDPLHTTLTRTPTHNTRHSIATSVGELGLQLRRTRSTSLRSATSSHKRHASTASTTTTSHKSPPSTTSSHKSQAPTTSPPTTTPPPAMHSLSLSPDKVPPAAPIAASRPTLSISTFARTKARSSDNVKHDNPQLHHLHYDKGPLSAPDKPKTPFAMPVPMPLRHPPAANTAPQAPVAPLPNAPNPNIVFHHIHELASKRISTLDYLRKAHEGRIYWFNTLLFSKPDLARLPSFTLRAQSRRATHYLLLGFSLPTILDLHANSPADYLRALNALLLEFEQYQSMHPADGSTPSLGRARIPHMFKRANLAAKSRRSSSATADFPLLTPQSSFGSDSSSLAAMLEPNTADDLGPGESYLYLQTPSLPFDPDFFSTFATLCDVLIDCYTKMLAMLSTPDSVALAGAGVPATVGDLFSKADARVRKIILAGLVREFEESCRQGVRSEMGGVAKVVLGGLM